ncbi:hypothetical protein AWB85_15505 [Mycobacteroides immunogenum]|uniref:Thioesterase n=1 Tax=Mycobacteroides immunogenum TaxID=83262 RepID=A0A179V7Q2_9MYCO|nr:DUF4442 domain-containing protein [Mycobacteroides immunogenum]OAT67015.1 hypothetical protein AWB85_15505 [Mycobacteroides immunogenum]
MGLNGAAGGGEAGEPAPFGDTGPIGEGGDVEGLEITGFVWPEIEPTEQTEFFNLMARLLMPRVYEIGFIAREVEYCRAVATVPLKGNVNHDGVVLPSVVFALAESTCTAVAIGTFDVARFRPIVKGVSITFVRAARSPLRAEVILGGRAAELADTVVHSVGKADFDLGGRVFDDAGQLVAKIVGRYQIRAHGG